jgi:hypothetical protein
MADDSPQLALMQAEIAHIKEKVDDIDTELKQMKLGARIAVIEDRQSVLFKVVHGTIGLFGTIIAGIIIWLFTH